MSSFTGFPSDAVDFYAELEANNTRQWWLEHKPTYDAAVRGPMDALLHDLEDEFGPGKAFRPNRDVRFSADKSPYKTHQGGFIERCDWAGWYAHIDADGLMTAGGSHTLASDQLKRLREAIDAPRGGQELERLVGELAADGWEIGGAQLATKPRGYDADHPRLDLLRRTALTASRHHGTPPWLATEEAADRIREDFRDLRPLVEWLAEHVGATATKRGPARR